MLETVLTIVLIAVLAASVLSFAVMGWRQFRRRRDNIQTRLADRLGLLGLSQRHKLRRRCRRIAGQQKTALPLRRTFTQ